MPTSYSAIPVSPTQISNALNAIEKKIKQDIKTDPVFLEIFTSARNSATTEVNTFIVFKIIDKLLSTNLRDSGFISQNIAARIIKNINELSTDNSLEYLTYAINIANDRRYYEIIPLLVTEVIRQKGNDIDTLLEAISNFAARGLPQIIPLLINQVIQLQKINIHNTRQTSKIKVKLLELLGEEKTDISLRQALSAITFASKSKIEQNPDLKNLGTQTRKKFNEVHRITDEAKNFIGSTFVAAMPCIADIKELLLQAANGDKNRKIELNILCCQEPGEQIYFSGKVIEKWGIHGSDQEIFSDMNPRFKKICEDLKKLYPNLDITFVRPTPGGLVDHTSVNATTGEEFTVADFKAFLQKQKLEPEKNTTAINFIHCQAGMSRSVMTAIGTLIENEGYTLSEACHQVKYGIKPGEPITPENKNLGRSIAKNFEKLDAGQKILLANYYAEKVLTEEYRLDAKSLRLMLIYCDTNNRNQLMSYRKEKNMPHSADDFVNELLSDKDKLATLTKETPEIKQNTINYINSFTKFQDEKAIALCEKIIPSRKSYSKYSIFAPIITNPTASSCAENISSLEFDHRITSVII